MSILEKLLVFTGYWQGTNSLWLSPQEPARESSTTLSLAPAVNQKFMLCQGVIDENGMVDLRGFYQVSTGPDWGWRIEITPESENALNVVMYNIWPEGKEELAVKAEYVPSIE